MFSMADQRLAICVSGEIRGLLPRLPTWSHLVRRNLIDASGATHADIFLVLSGLGSSNDLEQVREKL